MISQIIIEEGMPILQNKQKKNYTKIYTRINILSNKNKFECLKVQV